MGIGVSVSCEVYWLVFVSVFFSVHVGNTQLLINVKNQVSGCNGSSIIFASQYVKNCLQFLKLYSI